MSKKQKHIITLVDDGTKDKKGNNSKKSLKKKKKKLNLKIISSILKTTQLEPSTKK